MFKYFKQLNIDNGIAKLTNNLKKLYKYLVDEFILSLNKLKNLTKTNFNLGLYHLNKNNLNDAILRFNLVNWLTPNYAESHYYLACSYYLKKEYKKSKKHFLKTLELEPNHEKAKYRLNQLSEKKPSTIPYIIIKEDLDFASNSYKDSAYDILVNEFNKIFLASDTKKNILEIGCKTGDFGLKIKNISDNFKLVGLEISTLMIENANNKICNQHKVYSYLFCQNYLIDQKVPGKYDVIFLNKALIHTTDFVLALNNFIDLLNDNGFIFFVSNISDTLNYDWQKNCFLSNKSNLDKVFKDLPLNLVDSFMINNNSEALYMFKKA